MCSDKTTRFPIDALEEHLRAVGPINISAMVSWLTEQFNLGILDMGEIMGQVGTRLELYEPTDPTMGYLVRPQDEPDFSDLMAKIGTPKSPPAARKTYAVLEWSPEDVQTVVEKLGMEHRSLDQCEIWLRDNENRIKNQLNDDGFDCIQALLLDEA